MHILSPCSTIEQLQLCYPSSVKTGGSPALPVLPVNLLLRPAWTLLNQDVDGILSTSKMAAANYFSLIGHFSYFGASSRSRAVKYSWLCCVLKIRLISTPRLFSSSASSLSFSEEQHKHVLAHVLDTRSSFQRRCLASF